MGLEAGAIAAIVAATATVGGTAYQMTQKPKSPKQPTKRATGEVVADKGADSFKEEVDTGNKRQTARKGTSNFQIPLSATATPKTGAGVTASSGLKI